MSLTYTFTPATRVTVGNPTKKTDVDKIAANTDEIKELLKAIPYLGDFGNTAGTTTISYNANGTINVITMATMPIGTITHDYNANLTINYIEMVLTNPVAITVRDTYAYNSDLTISGITRTVS